MTDIFKVNYVDKYTQHGLMFSHPFAKFLPGETGEMMNIVIQGENHG
jgi:hypothetical protein